VHKCAMWLKGKYEYPGGAHFTVGRYFYTMILEPEKIDLFVVSKYRTRDSAGFKAEKEENSKVGLETVTAKESEYVSRMVMEIMGRPLLQDIINASDKEIPYIDEINGVPVKCKVDMELTLSGELAEAINRFSGDDVWWEGAKLTGDLKSTGKPVSEFRASARGYKYGRQASMYKKISDADGFFFIPSEKGFPFTPALYWAGPQFLKQGSDMMNRDLMFWKQLFMDGGYDRNYLYEQVL